MKETIACLFIVLGLSAENYAEVVAGWDVEGVNVDDGIGIETNLSPFIFQATTSETAYVQAQLSLGSGVNPSTTTDQYGFKISVINQTNTLSGAISLNQYIDISILIDEGKALNLSSIEMKGGGSSTACSNVAFMTSIDGFVSGQEIATTSVANENFGMDTDSSGFGSPIDLSASKYQNLTGSVSFRLYGWDSISASGANRIRNLAGDDLVIYGEVMDLFGEGMPSLFFTSSNGISHVAVEFNGDATTNHVLQSSPNMVSNVWTTVSTPFAINTNWVVATTNDAVFYRLIAE